MKSTDKADFTLTPGAKGGPWMMAKDNGNPQGPAKYPSASVAYGNDGHFTFALKDAANVTFAANDPFTQKSGAGQPNDFKHQFSVTGGGTTTLVVTDQNTKQGGGKYTGGSYSYQLNLSNGQSVDPIIVNGGCCNAKPSSTAYLILAAVALAVVVVLAMKFLKPGRSDRPEGL